MIKKKLFSVLIAIIGISSTAFAQDPQFSQFYANPLYLNPALVGGENCPRLTMNYRNQWPNLPGTFVTNSVSLDQNIESLHGGLGVSILNDNAGQGAITTTQVSAAYSYQLRVSKKFTVQAGFQVTYNQRNLDKNKLSFGDEIDSQFGFIHPTKEDLAALQDNISYTDVSIGFIGFTERFFAGFALHHLNQPGDAFFQDFATPNGGALVEADSQLPTKLTVHAGANIPYGKNVRKGVIGNSPFITPGILYQTQSGADQMNYGLSITNNSVSGGVWYRSSSENADAILLVAGYEVGIYRIGYSYDYTVSKLSDTTGGAHELSLRIKLPCREKRKTLRAIKCPKF